MKRLFLQFSFSLLLILSPLWAQANLPPAVKTLMTQSQQLVVVISPDWNSLNGQLQRYERSPEHPKWTAVGPKIPVVVGSRGMAWGVELQTYHPPGPFKKEKDYRTPAGLYKIGPAFGYPAQPPLHVKLDYLAVNDTFFCNDNPGETYNTLIPNKVDPIRTEWRDAELFRWGAVVQYNTEMPVPDAGSCIFLHIWENPMIGTKGCIAMGVENLEMLIKWLDPAQTPMILLLPKNQYHHLQKAWALPPITWSQKLMSSLRK